jgi:hypothetical protein
MFRRTLVASAAGVATSLATSLVSAWFIFGGHKPPQYWSLVQLLALPVALGLSGSPAFEPTQPRQAIHSRDHLNAH